jgi:hypothetical protein
MRRLRFEWTDSGNSGNSLLGYFLSSSQSVAYQPPLDGLRGFMFMDSTGSAQSPGASVGTYAWDQIHWRALKYAGIRYVQGMTNAGAGYSAGSTAFNVFTNASKLPLVLQYGMHPEGLFFTPDVIVFAMGFNDVTTTPSVVTFDALNSFMLGRQLYPSATAIVFGPMLGRHQALIPSAAAATEAAVLAAFTQWNDPNSVYVPVLQDPNGPWTTGSGYVGSPTGSGNSDFYVGSDGTHPPIWGEEYYGQRYGRAIDATLTAKGM